MARLLRIAVADGWYHVFGRGLERREIFRDDADRRHLLELLEVLHARYRVLIHAYALMDYHYHAIVRTPDAKLSQGMQWLHGSYSAGYNARHQRVGPVFQGRYRAVPASLRGITGKAALRRRVTWQAVRAAAEEMKGEPRDHFAERRGDQGPRSLPLGGTALLRVDRE